MEPKNNNKKPFYKRLLPMLLLVVLIGGAIFGIKEWIFYSHYETTDDAQVDGDISPVISRVGGYIKEIRFKDNQWVHQGDTLVILDDKDYQLALEKAKAALTAEKSGVQVSDAQVSSVQANIPPATADIAIAQAKLWEVTKTYNRYKNLLANQAITQAQFDAIKAKKQVAEAAVRASKKQVKAIQHKVASSRASVKASKSQIAIRQAAVDQAKLQLSYIVITAPVSGVVSNRNIQIGQLVGQGQKLFAIVNTKDLYITANFKETQLTRMKVGQPVEIDVDTYPNHHFEGRVTSFSGATGAKFSLLPPNNATGNYVKVVQRVPVRINFDHLSKEWQRKLIPGMSTEIKVRIKK